MNNNQIDNTDYYRLPCGKQLEDFIAWKRLDFFEGSALKYMWRAGKKDGEPKEKDDRKFDHYCDFMAREFDVPCYQILGHMHVLKREANDWDGVRR